MRSARIQRGGGSVPFGDSIQSLVFDEEFEDEQEDRGAAESDQRRNQQNFEDAAGLLPVDAAGTGMGVHELVGDADADDGADEGVGTGCGQAEPPGAEVPDDGGDEEGEDHGEAGALADLEDQLDGQQGEDGEGDRAGGSEYADEVPQAGPDDGDVGLKRMRVDDGSDGVGGVVEAVDEFETESDEQGEAQQSIRPGGEEVGSGKIARQLLACIGEAAE